MAVCYTAPAFRNAGAGWRQLVLLTLKKPNCLLFFVVLWLCAFEVSFLAIDDGLEAIPFCGNPFCTSCIEDEEMEAVVGGIYLY